MVVGVERLGPLVYTIPNALRFTFYVLRFTPELADCAPINERAYLYMVVDFLARREEPQAAFLAQHMARGLPLVRGFEGAHVIPGAHKLPLREVGQFGGPVPDVRAEAQGAVGDSGLGETLGV